MSDSLKHMINTMVANIKLDTDHSFHSYHAELSALDKKLADAESLFMQGIAAIREQRGRIQRVLNGPPQQESVTQLPPERPIPRAIQRQS
jgi:hypothetical protein